MVNFLLRLAKRLGLDIESLDPFRRISALSDFFGLLYAAPLAVIGLIWLIMATEWKLFSEQAPLFLFILVIGFILETLGFYMFVSLGKITGGGSFHGSFNTIIIWSGAFLLGVNAFWIAVIVFLVNFIRRQNTTRGEVWSRLSQLRNGTFTLADSTFANLVGLIVYQQLNGAIPIRDLTWSSIYPALWGILAHFAISEVLITMPYMFFAGKQISRVMGTSMSEIVNFTFITLAFSALIQPFSILAGGIYSVGGFEAYLFFVIALILTSALAHQLSQAAERSHQRTQELGHLEQLGRSILNSPPDASALPDLLKTYVPTMFSLSVVVIRLFPENDLLKNPDLPTPAAMWEWIKNIREVGIIQPNEDAPWNSKEDLKGTLYTRIYAPILDVQTSRCIGGIYLVTQHPDRKGIVHWLPAVQSLAAQIASTIHSAEVYKQTLEHEKTLQELAFAGRIQTSFLPNAIPKIKGWHLSANLDPARQTSGDFYDFIPLSNNRLGILVADVADKGVGAALYMALSRTLIRTYATEYPEKPEEALKAANLRILADTQSDLFVTVFYGVLDLETSMLTYCNAGHNPAYLCHFSNGGHVDSLTKTGIPLGMFEHVKWGNKTIPLAVGDLVVLYTDGLTEAHNLSGEQFGEERLLAIVQENHKTMAPTLHTKIREGVQMFMGSAPQFDDITLMVIQRNQQA